MKTVAGRYVLDHQNSSVVLAQLVWPLKLETSRPRHTCPITSAASEVDLAVKHHVGQPRCAHAGEVGNQQHVKQAQGGSFASLSHYLGSFTYLNF